ncbi:MAG: porin, partial [Mesorhizobium sp.]
SNVVAAGGRGFYKPWAGKWAFWTGGTYKFTDKAAFNLQVSGDQDKNYALAANVAYTIVPGFTITPEVDYFHYGRFGESTPFSNWTKADKKNSWGGIVRFQRNF